MIPVENLVSRPMTLEESGSPALMSKRVVKRESTKIEGMH